MHSTTPEQTRRNFLGRTSMGLGALAAASISQDSDLLARHRKTGPGMGLHHPAKAKRVIYLFQSGGPSQMELFDYKPALMKVHGDELPNSVRGDQRLTGMTSGQSTFPMVSSRMFKFKQHGNSGTWISDLLPYTSEIADDICIIKSMHTEAINHDPAITYIQSGSQIPGRPSLGAWLSYGLGSMNENLPSYVVMHARTRHPEQSLFGRLWGSGFMSSQHQGVLLRSQGDPVLYLNNPAGVTREDRRAQLDALSALNKSQQERFADPSVLDRIKQHEMAYRMQSSVPELMDLSKEPESTFKLYGDDAKTPGTFAACCLNARRLAERGVRNIQVFHRGWDAHGNLAGEHGNQCKDVDQGSAALIKDLKQRGLFDETLVVWGTEFGRTPGAENSDGRDHHPNAFSVWMAGGGVKGGTVYGTTDELGWAPAENPVHVNDFQATLLRLFGLDHERLTVNHRGLGVRLTNLGGNVIEDVIA